MPRSRLVSDHASQITVTAAALPTSPQLSSAYPVGSSTGTVQSNETSDIVELPLLQTWSTSSTTSTSTLSSSSNNVQSSELILSDTNAESNSIRPADIPEPPGDLMCPKQVQRMFDERLCQAAADGQEQVIRTLLGLSSDWVIGSKTSEALARIDAQETFSSELSCMTPLMLASAHGHANIVKLLLDCGANTDLVNSEGCSALHCAALNGHLDSIKLLAEVSKLDARDNNSYTPLLCAAFRGHLPAVMLLLQRKASINHCAKGGATALLLAALQGNSYTVQCLVSRGADINHCDSLGRSLSSLVASGRRPELKLAFDHGRQMRAFIQNQPEDSSTHLLPSSEQLLSIASGMPLVVSSATFELESNLASQPQTIQTATGIGTSSTSSA